MKYFMTNKLQHILYTEFPMAWRLPKEKSTSIAPTATADPLEDPPGTLSAAQGFLGVP